MRKNTLLIVVFLAALAAGILAGDYFKISFLTEEESLESRLASGMVENVSVSFSGTVEEVTENSLTLSCGEEILTLPLAQNVNVRLVQMLEGSEEDVEVMMEELEQEAAGIEILTAGSEVTVRTELEEGELVAKLIFVK